MDELLRALVSEHRACLDTLIEFTDRVDRLPDGMQLTQGSTLAGRQLTAGDFKCLRSLAQSLIVASKNLGDSI